ncbi:adhesin [Lactiplantibacillus plantarum]|nr:adhesin [Lactiplantibacillus plantarum]
MDDGSVTGTKSLDANGTLIQSGDNGTVIYVYVPEYMAIVKTVNETINYVDENGHALTTSYTANPIHILTVTNPVDGTTTTYYSTITTSIELDATTGRPVDSGWVLGNSQDFDAVTNPQIKGYTVTSTDAPNSDLQHVSAQTVTGDSGDLEFTVVYTKNAPIVTTESKTVNETIHYVYTDGTTAHDDYVAQPITFTRTVFTDAVTGEKTYGGWSAAQQFAAVDSPAIKGYTPDQSKISTQTVTGDSSDLEFTVVYKADSTSTKPVKPEQPTIPTTPTEPVKPGQPTTPTEPVKPGQPTTPTEPVKPGQPTTSTQPVKPGQLTTPAKPDQPMTSDKSVQTITIKFVGQRLPQTNETDQQHMTLSGLLLLAMSGLLGLLGMAKRQHKE